MIRYWTDQDRSKQAEMRIYSVNTTVPQCWDVIRSFALCYFRLVLVHTVSSDSTNSSNSSNSTSHSVFITAQHSKQKMNQEVTDGEELMSDDWRLTTYNSNTWRLTTDDLSLDDLMTHDLTPTNSRLEELTKQLSSLDSWDSDVTKSSLTVEVVTWQQSSLTVEIVTCQQSSVTVEKATTTRVDDSTWVRAKRSSQTNRRRRSQ